jgi:serine/threonine protein kinase HipA of HipAB toxin-antitoxin module
MDPVSRAQATGISDKSKANLRPWKKGQSGNPQGRPKKLHITKIFEKLLAKSDNRKEISDAIMATLTSKGMAKVLMLREMAERTEGKVTQEVDMNIAGTLALADVIAERRKKLANRKS